MRMTLVEFVDKMRETFGESAFWDMQDDGSIVIETNLYYQEGNVMSEDEL